MDLSRDVVMGHEFVAEVVEVGENVGNSSVGDIVVSMPMTFDERGIFPIGYSNEYPGGYGELMALSDMLSIRVPNGLDTDHAALTEPMAVGVHAVNKSRIQQGEAAVVLGCGPVGLAVIADLHRKGIEPIVAADFSAKRRELAKVLGAHEVVDPRVEPAVDAWRRVDARHANRNLVIYEAVGVPGMIDAAIASAPRNARILVVGVCMQPDTIRPMLAIGRELADPVRARLRPHRVRRHLAGHRRGRIDRGTDDHRPRRHRRRPPGLFGSRRSRGPRQDPRGPGLNDRHRLPMGIGRVRHRKKLMAKVKVRCSGCGKMNRDELADRCSVCGTILADAARRRAAKLGSVSEGPAFTVLVENEVAAWKEYAEGRSRAGNKSRRPSELDEDSKPSKFPWRRGKESSEPSE